MLLETVVFVFARFALVYRHGGFAEVSETGLSVAHDIINNVGSSLLVAAVRCLVVFSMLALYMTMADVCHCHV